MTHFGNKAKNSKICGADFEKNVVQKILPRGHDPQILSPIPDVIGQFCRPLRGARYGPLSSIYSRTVYDADAEAI